MREDYDVTIVFISEQVQALRGQTVVLTLYYDHHQWLLEKTAVVHRVLRELPIAFNLSDFFCNTIFLEFISY